MFYDVMYMLGIKSDIIERYGNVSDAKNNVQIVIFWIRIRIGCHFGLNIGGGNRIFNQL